MSGTTMTERMWAAYEVSPGVTCVFHAFEVRLQPDASWEFIPESTAQIITWKRHHLEMVGR